MFNNCLSVSICHNFHTLYHQTFTFAFLTDGCLLHIILVDYCMTPLTHVLLHFLSIYVPPITQNDLYFSTTYL